ncbi:MAG TPA: UDP-3-O-acyl-N-acetylglucosamine deacetylase [Fibrobacteria bacterium]|nr:UDP-3-O-acyl-N-acetylglucosamine deacetylase [Fibrobacteria bacterium]
MISGRALHSGVPSDVRITPRPDDGLGIRFLFPGFAGPLDARALSTLKRTARRATLLEDPETGATIRTPEHMLAAALFFARAPLDVACDASEPPGLDGSARPWFTALAAAAPAEYAVPPREYDVAKGFRYDGPEGSLLAEPAEHFSVEYTVERGEFRQAFRLESGGAAAAEILPARTFIFWKEWRALSLEFSGLLRGAGAESGLLLAETPEEFADARALLPELSGQAFPLLSPETPRYPEEAARHKVLDLLGDLALNGLALPRLRLTLRNGGHALNHLLLNHLQA